MDRSPVLLASLLVVAACGQIVAPAADAPERPTDAAPDGGGVTDAPTTAIDAPTSAVDAPSGLVVTVVRDGAGAGDVKSVPDGIACGSLCAATFAAGASVELTAAPHPGAYFAGWNEPACGIAPTCVLVVTAPREVIAKFELAP